MQQRGYVEHLMEEIVSATARIADLTGEGKLADAERELDAAWTSTLGFRRADAARLDEGTLRVLLGAKATCAAKLLAAESAIEEARGNTAAAKTLRDRASKL